MEAQSGKALEEFVWFPLISSLPLIRVICLIRFV